MRSFLLLISMIFIFAGCQEKQAVQIPLKKYHSINKFNYTKEQISFFEKEFITILQSDNIKILNIYKEFYEKNKSYFVNGKQKVEAIQRKIALISNEKSTQAKMQDIKKLEKKEAIKKYTSLAKNGNIQAKRELVDIYKINNPDLALKYLEELVALGDIQSMKEYASSNIYMVRPVIVQDIPKAIKTYESLANLGELSALMRLGNIYEYGYHKQAASQDKEKSLEYYEKASSQGYEIAQKKLLKIYSCKECTPNRYNEEKAKILQEILIDKVNSRLSKVLEKKPKKETTTSPVKEKKIEQEIVKKEEKIEPVKIAVKEEKNIDSEIVETKQEIQEEQEKEQNVVSVIAQKTKTTKPRKKTIKCYDMAVADISLSKKCKEDITSYVKENKDLSKINIIAILDKKDKEYFQKQVKSEKLLNSLLKSLANDRAFETVWFLQSKLKDDSIINVSTYHVTSKKSNKGVVLKFY